MNARPIKPQEKTSALESIKTVILLLITLVAFQFGNMILGVTNGINGSHRQEQLDRIQQNYMPWILAIDFLELTQAQTDEFIAIIKDDYPRIEEANNKFKNLRSRWIEDINGVRGGSSESSLSSSE